MNVTGEGARDEDMTSTAGREAMYQLPKADAIEYLQYRLGLNSLVESGRF